MNIQAAACRIPVSCVVIAAGIGFVKSVNQKIQIAKRGGNPVFRTFAIVTLTSMAIGNTRCFIEFAGQAGFVYSEVLSIPPYVRLSNE